jgi:hypothetical protein
MNYPNEALTDVCDLLMDDYGLTLEQINNLAANIPGECAAMADNRAEAAWLDRQQSLMESGGVDDSAYRRDVIAAGRGHLLGGA